MSKKPDTGYGRNLKPQPEYGAVPELVTGYAEDGGPDFNEYGGRFDFRSSPGRTTAIIARDAYAGASTPSRVPAPVKSALSSESGSPLPDAKRWSKSMGTDVSDARVVTGAAASEAATSISARAFTVGNRIFFNEGTYSPGDGGGGDKLIRHELTHVVQQRGASLASYDDLRITSPHDHVEHEARSVAGGSAHAGGTSGAVIALDGPLDDAMMVDATTWLKNWGLKVQPDLIARLQETEFALNSPFVTWKAGSSKEFVTKAFKFTPDIVASVGGIIGRDQVLRAADRGREMRDDPMTVSPAKGTIMKYSTNVANELANLVVPKINESLARMVPRYIRARNAAKMEHDAKSGSDSTFVPEPKDLITSVIMDYAMADALEAGVITMTMDNIKDFRAQYPELAKGKEELRPITITYDLVGKNFFWVVAKPVKDDGKPATPEEVSKALFGTTAHTDSLQAAPPRYGCKDASELLEMHKTALRSRGASDDFLKGWVNASVDPTEELLKGKNADDIALQQAGNYKATGASRKEIIDRLGESRELIEGFAVGAKRFGMDGRVADAKKRIEDRRKAIEASTDAGEAMKWDQHSARQHDLLVAAKGGIDGVVAYLDGFVDKVKDPAGSNLGTELRFLLRENAEGWVIGVAQSHLVDLAAAKLSAAGQKMQSLPFDIMEALLRSCEQTIAAAAKKDGDKYDAAGMKKRSAALRDKITKARSEILANPAKIQLLIDELFTEVGDFQTETAMVANMDQLDDLHDQLVAETKGFLANYKACDPDGYGECSESLAEIIRAELPKLEAVQTKWKPIYKAWKATEGMKDPDEQKTAREKVKKDLKAFLTDPEYTKTIESFGKLLNDVREAKAIMKIVFTIVGVIAITIVSMGIGAAVGSFATGALAGAVTAGTITAGTASIIAGGAALVTEAAVFTALNTVFFVENPTWKGVLTEFAFNLGVFGAMKAVSKAYRSIVAVDAALKGAGVAKWAAVAGEGGLQSVTMAIASIAHEKLIDGKNVTPEQRNMIFAQSAGMFIAMAIIGRAAAPLFTEIEKAAGTIGARVAGMNLARAKLVGAAIAAKGTPEASKIAALVKMDATELNSEMEVMELISKSPGELAAAGFNAKEVAAITHDAGLAVYQAKVGEALRIHTIQIAPGEYRCTVDQKAKILEAYGKDAAVEPAGKDATAKTETFKITPKEGPSIRLTVGEPRPTDSVVGASADPKTIPGTTAEPAPGEPPKLEGVPAGKEDIARWQTKGITSDAPGLWAKKAKDGTAFRDAYEKWIKQEKPYTEAADGKLEPVKPSDVSDAAWGEFKSTFEGILKKGNITLTTKGAEAIAKLKAKGIDLAKIDPQTPEYQKIRPELVKEMGEAAVKRWEATMTNRPGDPARKDLDARMAKLLAGSASAKLKGEFPDCEIILTGSASQPGKPITDVKDLDVILIAPEKATPAWRVAAEERLNKMTVDTGEALVKEGGPKTLKVDGKVMTKEQYLGIRSVDPGTRTPMEDFRIDDNFKNTTTADVGKGFDGAKGEVGKDGQLPADVIGLITKALPGATIDPANPIPGIEAYLKTRYPSAKDLKVEALGGGKSGAQVFAVKDGSKTIGIFKIFRNATEMAREIASLKQLADLKLSILEPVGIDHAAKVAGKPGEAPTGAAVMDPAKGDFIKATLDGAGKADGRARVDAVAKLTKDAKQVARGLAEMHSKAASGDKVTAEYKEQEIKYLKDRWTAIKATGKVPRAEVAKIDAQLEALFKGFREADVDATKVHGDAHAGNFAAQSNGKVSVIDAETLYRSVDTKTGKGIAPAAVDVGRFMESLRVFGTEAGLSPAEIAKIQADFLVEYKAHLKGGGAGFDASVKFYQANLDTIALKGAVDKGFTPKPGTPPDEVAAAKELVKSHVQALKSSLGMPSAYDVPPDALTMDAATKKEFEEWLKTATLSKKPDANTEYLQRLKDFYGRDPVAAVELARTKYGFGKPPGATPESAGDLATNAEGGAEAERMLKYLEHADPAFKAGKKLTPAEVEQFKKNYENGEKFDPITRRWFKPGAGAVEGNVFPATFTPKEVADVLMGVKAEPTPDVPAGTPAPKPKFQSSFKPFAELIKKLGLGSDATIEKIIGEVGYKDAYVDTVRSRVKKEFRAKILDKLTKPTDAELKADPDFAKLDWTGDRDAAYEEARFRNVRKQLAGLHESDRGNLMEEWRYQIGGAKDPSGRHLVVTPKMAGDAGVTINGKNILDMLEGSKIYDNKDYKGSMAGLEPQLVEQLKIAGLETGKPTTLEIPNKADPGKTKTVTIDGVIWGETDPAGVKLNAEWMFTQLSKYPGKLQFEIWNNKGQKVLVPSKDMSAGDLMSSKLDQFLLGK